MTWLRAYVEAEPLEAGLLGLAILVGVVAILYGVGLYRAIRDEMRA